MVDWDKVIDAFIIIYLIKRLSGTSGGSVTCDCLSAPNVPSDASSVYTYGSAIYVYGVSAVSNVESSVGVSIADIPSESVGMNTYISLEEYNG